MLSASAVTATGASSQLSTQIWLSAGAVTSSAGAVGLTVGTAPLSSMATSSTGASAALTTAIRLAAAADTATGGAAALSTTVVVDQPPVSDEDFAEWLQSDEAITNILVETYALVSGVRTPFFWSTLGYTTEGINSPIFYAPIISASIPFTEALSTTGGATLTAGDIEVDNTNGVNEHLIRYAWEDDLLALVGDVRWGRADYRPIFVGQSAGLVRKGRQAFALRQRDMMEGLNFSLSENKVGGTGLNAEEYVPLTFGECFNPSGVWSNAAALERQWHDGPIEAIKEVRANALPITEQATVFESTGKCQLTVNNESAAITATVQGDKHGGVFRTTIATIVERLVTGYGKEEGRYTSADIDAANFAAFGAANAQPVGLHVNSAGMNLLTACDTLAASVGAQLAPTREGKLQLVQIALPAAGLATEIRPEHMREESLRHIQRIDPVAAVRVAYLKNWTPQTGLQSNIPAAHKSLFENEWRYVTVGDRYRGDTKEVNTMLLRRVDALAEAERQLALWGLARDIYEFDGVPEMLQLRKGQRLIVYHGSFDMADGVEAQVLELTPDWKARAVKVRFLA